MPAPDRGTPSPLTEPAPSGPADAPAPAAGGDAGEKRAAPLPLPAQLAANIDKIEALTARMVAVLSQRGIPNPAVEAPGPEFFATATQAFVRSLYENPGRLMQAQTRYWAETLRLATEAQAELASGRLSAPETPAGRDARFRNPLWHSHPWFAFIRRQYEINARALSAAMAALPVDDQVERRRIDWFTRQLIDMMAPTNFLATNPDALERAIETEGESLVRGLENLISDLESARGDFAVNLVDKSAFKVGENIATAPGDVVARTPLYELIQYRPTTDQAHQLPLILFPPWINKFYILDLKPQNSLIRWLVAQGFTLFVVSWRNPGPSMGSLGMDDYAGAYLDAMDRVRALTGEARLNAVGYCIGGTMLHLVLGLLAKRGDDRVAAATFFTTLVDFSEQGEFTTFLQDDFVGGIEAEVESRGILGAQMMARTFSFLRANDLIWGPAIRSYMMGDTPPAFDLLYWNSDATNLPGKMATQYLRGICQGNALAKNGYEVLGEVVRLSDVTVPCCSVACEGDHIAPWLDCWRGFSMLGAEDRNFVLCQSGHIAGIINPPGRVKYGHYTSDAGFGGTAEAWRAKAEHQEGSWWPTWLDWLAPRSGPMVPARHPAESLAEAPGTYVHIAADEAA